MSKSKWISGFVAVLILMLAVPVVSGHGGRWSGMDPEIRFNGQTLNVVVEWPEHHTCEIDGEIDIKVEVDKKAHVIFIGESSGTFECEGGTEEITLKTMTVLKETKKKDSIRIRAKLAVEAPVTILREY